MQAAYEATSDRQVVVEAFLKACAYAVANPEAVAVMGTLNLVSDFPVSAAHPHDRRQFDPPAPVEGA